MILVTPPYIADQEGISHPLRLLGACPTYPWPSLHDLPSVSGIYQRPPTIGRVSETNDNGKRYSLELSPRKVDYQ